jgi:Predicted Rossmann fold nucleotide-binding protein
MKNKKLELTKPKKENSGSIIKIRGEFVEGYEKLSAIGAGITFVGAARTKEEKKYYKLAEEIASESVGRGYGVITGGGAGMMEAAKKGAKENKGKEVGLRNDRAFEVPNKFIEEEKLLKGDYLFVRKVMVSR